MADRHFDIVIIGSGPGGGASAWALAGHGFSVLVLEAGPSYDPFKDYLLDKHGWEQQRFPDKARRKARYTHGAMQKLDPAVEGLRSWNHISGAINKSGRRKFERYEHVRGVGGSTLAFSAEAHRMHPQSMKMRTRFGVAADWPVDYAELEPYYVMAEKTIGVAGAEGDDPVRYRSSPYPLPPHEYSYASTKVAEGCRKLGLKTSSNPLAILSRPYDGRPICNYCAGCNRGCPLTDKGSVDVTFIRKALATGRCTIWEECQVTRIEPGPDDKVKDVHYVDGRGEAGRVSGDIVIVSCGAVETPRLLLHSTGILAPDGLANESGLVGRNFMETNGWVTSGLHPEPLASYRGVVADIVSWDYNAPDSIPGVAGGCRFAIATPEVDLMGPINYATRVVEGWGRKHRDDMARDFGNAISIASIGESLPNEGSYIDLDPDEKDELGVPLARIHSYVGEADLGRLKFMAGKAREIALASGVQKIFEEYGSYDFFNSSHVFGTCRMGDDPGDSVTDRFLKSHRWRNLFIVDSSVFPSSGGGESPSLTIEALAIRTAEHIKDSARRGEL